MKIVRDGKEIELTPEEIRIAWEEAQSKYDREDIDIFCEGSEYLLTDTEKDEAALRYRHMLNNSEDWWCIADEACRNIISKRMK